MAVEKAEFARWLADSFRSGLVAVDRNGRLVACNVEAQRVLGCPAGSAAEALGRDCREALADQPNLAHVLLEALDGRERPTRTELVLRARAGEPPRTIGFTLLPVHDGEGCVRGAALLFRDLTPYERMDEQDRLRDRLAALGQMAAGLAHEIRNPLAGMEVLAGLLRRRLHDRVEERELVEELTGELRRLAGTVSASLDFVRPVALRRENVDPVKVLEEALARALALRPFSGRLDRDYASSSFQIEADPDALGIVFTNLIANAIEAMATEDGPTRPPRLGLSMRLELADRPARPLRVEGSLPAAEPRSDRREVVVSVTDSGPGVPQELRDRIFYPFFSTKPLGCGVGLANVQKFVAGHGGRIELESPEGGGATFRVHLPLGEEPGA